jgi:hypothetical protein
MISNINVYLSIAEEALAETRRLMAAARSPRPDRDGHVIAWDPDRKSFKQSLVAIAFAGMYLEALLFLVGVSRLGKAQYLEIDKRKYEVKLSALGITDPKLLAECERFRETRNDLIHEKAVKPHELDSASLRQAQHEAAAAVAFVKSVAAALSHGVL